MTSPSLARRLSGFDAIVIGLGAMLGAGVFVVWGPAAAEAGSSRGLLLALGLAAVVAACNATSSARLAARYPQAGGTYVYGRERLGPFAGFLAGWGFVVGKSASCAAMALTIGYYLWPGQARWVAAAAVIALTGVNLWGVTKTALATKVLVVVTLLVLALTITVGLSGSAAAPGGVGGGSAPLTAAGLIFFSFAGYARIATLGEEVIEPGRNIPRAIATALSIVLVIYVLVVVTCLQVLGIDALARSTAPLADLVRAAGAPELSAVVRVGAGLAVCGVLLSLLAGVGRTSMAMARQADLPRPLAAVHPRHSTPWVAELVLAALILAVVLLVDLRGAIGFSSFTVLTYYAVTNLAALTLPGRWTRGVAALGLAGCALLAFTLPLTSVIAGLAVLTAGVAARALTHPRP